MTILLVQELVAYTFLQCFFKLLYKVISNYTSIYKVVNIAALINSWKKEINLSQRYRNKRMKTKEKSEDYRYVF